MDMSMVLVPTAAASLASRPSSLARMQLSRMTMELSHDHANGDDEGRAGHQIDVEAGEVQQDHRQQNGQGHADAHDQAGSQVAEEDKQDEHGEDDAGDEGVENLTQGLQKHAI